MAVQILLIAGPTASGKSARAIEEALSRNGEIISVDSRQVYRDLDIGTEKITPEEMRGVPHYLIDIRDPQESYSAGDFVTDATKLIEEITSRGKLPILVGGTHFYFDALIKGLPAAVDTNNVLREELESVSTEELFTQISTADPRRASELDPNNRRRLIRALEITHALGTVPSRSASNNRYPQLVPIGTSCGYLTEWIVIDPEREALRERIDARLISAFDRGLIDEVKRIQEEVGDAKLNEFGLEYRVIGEFLRGDRTQESLLPTLSAKLWQYARRQKAWLRKLRDEVILAAPSHPNKN
ncbi:MAG: tRNA dimethylallyltransferase [Parcubacteria group bacterium]|nr:tRNA dimethylallyltransferase [Parcubacteria group bacterium]